MASFFVAPRTRLSVVLTAAAVLGGWLLYDRVSEEASEERHPAPMPSSSASATGSTIGATPVPPLQAEAPRKPGGHRQMIAAKAAAEAATVADVGELEPFLQNLKQRARRQGMVSALEVQAGLKAILRFEPKENASLISSPRAQKFVEDMQVLSAELSSPKVPGSERPQTEATGSRPSVKNPEFDAHTSP